MTLHVYTARISYSGPDRLDVTRKSATSEIGLLLAPSRSLLCKYHPAWGGRWNWREYRGDYLCELCRTYDRHPTRFDSLLFCRTEITLVCYCRVPGYCHRKLAAEWLEDHGAVYEGERTSGQSTLPGVG